LLAGVGRNVGDGLHVWLQGRRLAPPQAVGPPTVPPQGGLGLLAGVGRNVGDGLHVWLQGRRLAPRRQSDPRGED